MAAPVDHVGVHARLQPERPAVHELATGRRWTYAAFDRAIGACASVLVARDCLAGDRVAALARNCAELLILHQACARIGAIYVPLNWRLSAIELKALLKDAEPTLLYGDGELARAGLGGIDLGELAQHITAASPLVSAPIDRDRPSLVLYTSGTSGQPKGVLLSERNIEQTAINFGRLARVTHDSVFLIDSPMFHVIGLITSVRTPLMHGATLLVSEGFDAARTLARMGDPALGVSHYFAVPQMTAMLHDHASYDPAKLRALTGIFSGGAPHSAAAIRRWTDDGIAVVDGYGLSEGGTISCMPIDVTLIDARAGSAGVAMPGVMIRIIDDQEQECAPGTAGELLLKGDNLFCEYWRHPRETSDAFTADGWFRTGDIAILDDDGFLALVDRKKDMFISGGENIYPAELEAVLASHPDLVEYAIVGLPDPIWGEVGHIAFVARPGAAVDHEALVRHLEASVARYKLPKRSTAVERLPRTASGKVQKAALKELLMHSIPIAEV